MVAKSVPRHYILGVPAALRFIPPCSPIKANKPPAGDAWVHEPKLDGYRLQVVKDGRKVRLYGRNGHEWTKRFATLVEELAAIPGRSSVLDGKHSPARHRGAPGDKLSKQLVSEWTTNSV